MSAKVFGLFGYPIKGLSPEPLESVTLRAGRGVRGDWEFALALPMTVFDEGNPQPLPKFEFLMLARLTTSYDAGTGLLSVTDGAHGLLANVRSAEGRGAIAAFFARFLPEDQKSSQPRVVTAANHRFTDSHRLAHRLLRCRAHARRETDSAGRCSRPRRTFP
jgi:hypothetical protein